MPDQVHMAPLRLESARHDDRGHPATRPTGQPASSPRRQTGRAFDVLPYGVSEHSSVNYPHQLDEDFGPEGEDFGAAPGQQYVDPDTNEASLRHLRLDRSDYNRQPLEFPAQRSPSSAARPERPGRQVPPARPASMPVEPPEALDAQDNLPGANVEPAIIRPTARVPLTEAATSTDPELVSHHRELRDQLMRTIQLYSQDWKLGGIRAFDNKLVAHLIPRQRTIDLRDAIYRGQTLIITVDSRGNTYVKEPTRRSFIRRLFCWLFGGR